VREAERRTTGRRPARDAPDRSRRDAIRREGLGTGHFDRRRYEAEPDRSGGNEIREHFTAGESRTCGQSGSSPTAWSHHWKSGNGPRSGSLLVVVLERIDGAVQRRDRWTFDDHGSNVGLSEPP
jgi:hypothetical protein